MKFSIIIPCYNASKYIEKCIKSIIDQNFKDWEMIAVNDGSADCTLDILKSYEEKDSRIRIVDQKNKGVSAARNKAIEIAEGEYLLFVDSDDWYKDNHSLNHIAESLICNNNDIVVFRYQRIIGNNVNSKEDSLFYFNKMKEKIYTGEEYLFAVLSSNEQYMWVSWMYAFRREFWINNQFQFDEELRIAEDADLIYKIILKAQKISVLDSIIYQYRIRQNSVCRSISYELMKEQLKTFMKNITIVSRMDINEELKRRFYNNFVCIYFMILSMANYLNKNDRRKIVRILKKNQYLMNFATSRKNKIIKIVTHIVGIRFTSWILYIRLRYIKKINYDSGILC